VSGTDACGQEVLHRMGVVVVDLPRVGPTGRTLHVTSRDWLWPRIGESRWVSALVDPPRCQYNMKGGPPVRVSICSVESKEEVMPCPLSSLVGRDHTGCGALVVTQNLWHPKI
jgi:hypothetical protein